MDRRAGEETPDDPGVGHEVKGLRADGVAFPAYVAVSDMHLGDERRSTAIVRDISRQKALEASLVRAREVADSANQAKGGFLANMSHEIRTPLNAIIGLAHLLRRSWLAPEQSERVQKIDAAANHLLALICDILDFSKIEAGKLELEAIDFPLAALLDGVVQMIAEPAHEKGLEVRVRRDGVPDWLQGDPTRLRQALLNFSSNAVKFAERGTITVGAELVACDEEPGLLVRFWVQDEGIGIAPDKLASVFQAFEQADPSTSRRYGGTGLGLAITRRLAEMMGGEVGAESTPGRGSRFWFTARLRAGTSAEIAEAGERTAESGAEATLRRLHANARILLAEDQPINREVAVALLSGAGLVVEVAADGVEAVEMAARSHYDLVLLDVQMPRMDGLEAARAIRAQPGRACWPLIAMTANAFAEDRAACVAAGMDDFVTKPVDPQRLFGVLNDWLSRTAPRAAAQVAAPAPPPQVDAGGTVDAPPGFETAEALQRMRGDRALYDKILLRFAHSCKDELQAWGGRDRPARLRRLHDVASTAATVGACAVHDAARALETAMRAEGPADEVARRTEALLDAMRDAAATILESR